MKQWMWLAATLSTLGMGTVQAEQGYYRDPSIHGAHVVFTAEGDLWQAPIAGGQAQRLTTHAGEESQAHVSPDGQWVAFRASYDAAPEVYVMPMAGGQPIQMSFDGGSVSLEGWTPQGEVVMTSMALSGPSGARVLRVLKPGEHSPTTLPFAEAREAAFSSDGNTVFFTRFGLKVMNDHTRGYTGGAAGQLWRAPVDGSAEAVRLAEDVKATLHHPMFWNNQLYYVSEEGSLSSLWRMNTDGSERTRLTDQSSGDVRAPQLADGRIVYQSGADIRLFDIASGKDSLLNVTLRSDGEQRRTRWLNKPLKHTEYAALSADGERVAITARGAVTVAGTDAKRRVDVALPDSTRARSAVLSHDGQWVYAIADAEVDGARHGEVWRFAADGRSEAKALTKQSGTHLWSLHPSPDGKLIAYSNRRGELWVLNLATQTSHKIDETIYGTDRPYESIRWSPDSRHLVVARPDSQQTRSQIVLLSFDGRQKQVLTSDRYESMSPVMSHDGKWLYFLSNRSFVASPSAPWGDRNMGPGFQRRTQIYALALQADNRFVFQPEDELHQPSKDSKEEPSSDLAGKLPPIQWSGLNERLFQVPVPAGNYQNLSIDKERLYFTDRNGKNTALKTLKLANDAKPTTFMDGVSGYSLSADAKKLLLRKQGDTPSFYVVAAGAKKPESLDKHKVRVDDWKLAIEPTQEWRQMFLDAWRMHREFSFDPNMRGVDWDAVRKKYEPLLPRVTDRHELDDLMAQVSSELGILHSQIRPGEYRKDDENASFAALGGEWTPQADGLRLDTIYRTDPELPDQRAPLAKPGVDAQEGDVLVRANGRNITHQGDLARALANQTGKQVLLEWKRAGRTLQTVVTPVDARTLSQLRYQDWVQGNRTRVNQESDGRMGYLHLYAMGGRDIANFAREFYTNAYRDGLIIDVRRNRGGNIDSWVIEKLLRRSWAFWTLPQTPPMWNMQQSFRGHLVVLTDELTYSDGETFAAGVKSLGLAPIIGKRTAGAGIWLTDRNRLVDGGIARVAEFGQFDANGRWLIEGRGVSPNIIVDNPPVATFKGQDAQLAAAIDYLSKKMAEQPIKQAKPEAITPVGVPAKDAEPLP